MRMTENPVAPEQRSPAPPQTAFFRHLALIFPLFLYLSTGETAGEQVGVMGTSERRPHPNRGQVRNFSLAVVILQIP